jgi:trehalose-phosphatase
MSKPLFDAIREVGDRVALAPFRLLCVSFDGALVPFVDEPQAAALPPQVDRVLRSLAERPGAAVAIFSGRDRADLRGRVGIPNLIYVGNHGLDIGGPGFLFVESTAAGHAETLKQLAEALEQRLQPVAGVTVEYKGLTVSVHYRLAEPGAPEEVRRIMHTTLAAASYPFVLTAGPQVFEIRPRVYWTKGDAAKWIAQQLGRADTLTVYVGDDAADEDAFAALPGAITVKVGGSGETAAKYRVEGPAEVRKFLEWFDDVVRQNAP